MKEIQSVLYLSRTLKKSQQFNLNEICEQMVDVDVKWHNTH